jgi:hypothetical protein
LHVGVSSLVEGQPRVSSPLEVVEVYVDIAASLFGNKELGTVR